MACEECHDINPIGNESGSIVRISDLKSGCRFCALLLSLAKHYAPMVDNKDLDAKLRIDKLLEDDVAVNVEVFVNNLAQGPGSFLTAASFWVYRTAESEIADLPSLGRLGTLSPHSKSEECFQFAEDQIQSCLASHEKCTKPGLSALPKRVIFIGAAPTDSIMLAEPPKNSNEKYIALSHCWGTHQPIKTTLSNLAQMKTDIPWPSLSAVFQDAITVSRRLRIQYIWIDSLCIIQDSTPDWEIESSKMGSYYSGAYLTISASASPNGTVPFLCPRSPDFLPKTFPFHTSDGEVVNITARRHTGSSMSQLLEPLAPLASRGWVWQENILSTRTLHHTSSELIFECKTHLISEDGAKPRGFYSMGLSQKLLEKDVDPVRCWNALMESYSVRKLTFKRDRLPAVSGVAEVVESVMGGGGYLAGLWKKDLVMGLCWSRDYISMNEEVPLSLPEGYVAPSWSWASVHGAINFVDKIEESEGAFVEDVMVVDVACDVKGLNRFGEVRSGFLVLKGKVVKMRLNCGDPGNCWTFTVGEDPETREPMAPDCALIGYVGNTGEYSVRRAIAGDKPCPFELDVCCIKLGSEISSDDAVTYGMVVAKSQGDSDVYTRMGLVHLDGEWFGDAVEIELRLI